MCIKDQLFELENARFDFFQVREISLNHLLHFSRIKVHVINVEMDQFGEMLTGKMSGDITYPIHGELVVVYSEPLQPVAFGEDASQVTDVIIGKFAII